MLKLSAREVNVICDTLAGEFGAALHGPILEMVEACAEPSAAAFPDGQRASRLFLQGLATRAFWNAEKLAWVRALESAADAIAAECEAVTESIDDLPFYLGKEHTRVSSDRRDGLLPPAHGWKAFFLRRFGSWLRPNAARCPVTAEVLRQVPLSVEGDVMFSVLKPTSMIVPHHGLTNLDLTCHLGLRVPSDCAIEVGGEARTWERGRALVFDDTFRHWVWNRSESPRKILLFDFWSPMIARAHRPQLKRALFLVRTAAPEARTPSAEAQVPMTHLAGQGALSPVSIAGDR